MRHVYDVIVLGGQLGGAVAAALLAKRGYRVLLVEHDGMGHGYEHEGYLLPYAPFIAPPLKAMPALEEALVELGLNTTVQRTLRPNSPDLQLLLPQHRLDLHHDETKRTAELKREFGAAGKPINDKLEAAAAQHEASDAFFKEGPPLPPLGFFQAFALKRQIGRHPGLFSPPGLEGDEPAVRLLASLLPFVSFVDAPQEPLARARPMSQALLAPSRFPGGREGLRELFCKRLLELGGALLAREGSESSVAESFTFDGSKLVGLKVVRSDNDYRSACLVAATDSGALRRLLPEKKRHRALAEQLDLVTTKRFLFTVNWVVPVSVIPKGMGELALLDTGDGELGTLLVQVSPARKVGAKSEEEAERVVSAGAFVPASTRDLGEPHLAALVARIGAHLDALMPFALEKRKVESAPYLHAGGVRGSRLLPHPLYEVDTERHLGVTGLPPRSAVKNLFLASREVLPGLGLEGEVLAGTQAARLVQETLKKNDPLR
ncbi:MAG: NAD(P)-binding protein [Myxococcota bacterium]